MICLLSFVYRQDGISNCLTGANVLIVVLFKTIFYTNIKNCDVKQVVEYFLGWLFG